MTECHLSSVTANKSYNSCHDLATVMGPFIPQFGSQFVRCLTSLTFCVFVLQERLAIEFEHKYKHDLEEGEQPPPHCPVEDVVRLPWDAYNFGEVAVQAHKDRILDEPIVVEDSLDII